MWVFTSIVLMSKLTILASSYKAEKYLKEYFNSAENQIFKDFEITCEAVQPSPQELKIFNKAVKKYSFINLKIHNEKISLPEAWNKSLNRSKSELICIWNLDDLRTIDSLLKMVNVFQQDKSIEFLYGNYTVVNKFKKTRGNYINESGRENELKKSMILGPFFMFRRTVLEKVGFFDEQLISGADYDFAMRLARSCKGQHLDHNLGFYLNNRSGLSTKSDSLQEIERTVVEIRYNLEIINKSLIKKAQSMYNISQYNFNDKFEDIM